MGRCIGRHDAVGRKGQRVSTASLCRTFAGMTNYHSQFAGSAHIVGGRVSPVGDGLVTEAISRLDNSGKKTNRREAKVVDELERQLEEAYLNFLEYVAALTVGGKENLSPEEYKTYSLLADAKQSLVREIVQDLSDISARNEEREIMDRLLEMLKEGGRTCSSFRRNLRGFLEYARKHENGYRTILNGFCASSYHIGLLSFSHNHPGNELVDATMEYLNERYPGLI